MGLPDDYILPDNYNETCHLTGDGVVVPAVRFLADALIEPVVLRNRGAGKLTARETRLLPVKSAGWERVNAAEARADGSENPL